MDNLVQSPNVTLLDVCQQTMRALACESVGSIKHLLIKELCGRRVIGPNPLPFIQQVCGHLSCAQNTY